MKRSDVIFKDILLDKKTKDMGYAICPFLSEEKVVALRQFYDSNLPIVDSQFHSTPQINNPSYRKLVNQKIQDICSDEIQQVFNLDYSFFFGAFTVKEPNSDSEWDMHQDWSFVDEDRFTSYGVWIPLIDTSIENGCLAVVDRSHRFKPNKRGSGTISEYQNLSEFIKSKYLTYLPMKAGEAIVFYNNLLHYSPSNKSNEKRVSANFLMLPDNVPPLHYYRDESMPADRVEQFDINTEILLSHDFVSKGRPLNAKSQGQVDFDFSYMSESQFKKKYAAFNGKKYNNFFARILRS